MSDKKSYSRTSHGYQGHHDCPSVFGLQSQIEYGQPDSAQQTDHKGGQKKHLDNDRHVSHPNIHVPGRWTTCLKTLVPVPLGGSFISCRSRPNLLGLMGLEHSPAPAIFPNISGPGQKRAPRRKQCPRSAGFPRA